MNDKLRFQITVGNQLTNDGTTKVSSKIIEIGKNPASDIFTLGYTPDIQHELIAQFLESEEDQYLG